MSDSPHTPHPPETRSRACSTPPPRRCSPSSGEELEEAGYADIRPTHGCVFRFVREDGMRLTELAALAGMTKQSVGELVDDLVDLGYVERIPDPEDRRAKLICLTERGSEAQGVGFGLFAERRAALGRAIRRDADEAAARAAGRGRQRGRARRGT